ncbi:MAG: hypothetical protein DRH17_03855 [Deltaproteobacteria bacterium]|nr:hypothetical protein [Deltaproteobacteria bacterium]RLB83044.1 MAG: hypothetical protein DRH17_03855 [Deltaproteobacteria bacterium]
MSSDHLQPFGPVHPVPIVHFSLEFADAVRHLFQHLRPDAVAVELPHSLQDVVQKGVQRLPEISVVLYQNNRAETIYLPIEPTDPVVEAIRSGLEADVPVHFVDLDLDEYHSYRDYVPDTYAAYRLGIKAYFDIYSKEVLPMLKKGPADIRREAGMAYRLQKLAAKYNKILFVCGLAHLEGVKAAFFRPQAEPLERIKRSGVSLFHLHPEDLPEVMTEHPFLAAVYEYRRGGLPPKPELSKFTVRKKMGVLTLMSGGKDTCSEEEALDASIRWTVHHIKPGPVDRQLISYRLFEQAARHYRQDTGEEVYPWQKRAFFRFSRNYAFLENRLLPDFYQLLITARGCVDDNFCYAFWRLGSFYPWQKPQANIATIRISGEMLWLGTRKIHIRRRLPRIKRQPVYIPKKRRMKERRPGEWLEGFADPHICSYPPEDIIIEDYSHFLKSKGAHVLSADDAVSVPFETTILDGIDMRETVRHIHEGRIYVREFKRIKGGVGSVVVIFDEDKNEDRYPYLMTWLGEHDQESDMAFYATDPADHIVGPGISRCTYGGFLMTYPPLRLADVWGDPEYDWAQTKAERLLLAGLEYSLEKHVVYVAKAPPRSFIKQVAGRWGKRLVYIPIGQLSPIKLKQIRTLHVLAGKDKREIAKDYIW